MFKFVGLSLHKLMLIKMELFKAFIYYDAI